MTRNKSKYSVYLHAERGAHKIVDGCHLIAVEVDSNQQQHSTERRTHSAHSTYNINPAVKSKNVKIAHSQLPSVGFRS